MTIDPMHPRYWFKRHVMTEDEQRLAVLRFRIEQARRMSRMAGDAVKG